MKKRYLAAAAVVMLALTGCGEDLEDSSAQSFPVEAAEPLDIIETATFITGVDGDTFETDLGTIRIIGIDTPERGECGYPEATAAISDLLTLGDEVMLELPEGQNDTDRYDRLLRYVSVDGVDLGTMQIEAGNAVARYDSTDGYPGHPKQDVYRAAQTATLSPAGSVETPACKAAALEPPPAPEPTPETTSWWTHYPSCAALKRNTVGHPIGPFDVNNPDHALLYEWFAHQNGNRGDGDGDGLACE